MEEIIWRERVLAERVIEQEDWMLMANRQLDSQLERVSETLRRQIEANAEYQRTIDELSQQIETLTSVLEGLSHTRHEARIDKFISTQQDNG